MCTTTSNLIGYVADRDIKCYKALYNDNGKYMTPTQSYPTKLNSMLKPHYPSHPKARLNKYHFGEGYIHAFTGKDMPSVELMGKGVFQAYIPKGTRFWLDDTLEQLCAEQLFITDKQVVHTVFNPSDYFGCITDVLLDDYTCSKMVDGETVKGICVGSNVMSVDIKRNISYTEIENTHTLTRYHNKIYLSDSCLVGFLPTVELILKALTYLPDINLILYSLDKPLLNKEYIWAACYQQGSLGYIVDLNRGYIEDQDTEKSYPGGTMITFIQ